MTVTALDWAEAAARIFEPTTAVIPRWDAPGSMAVALDAKTRQTPALRLIDDALVDLLAEPDGRLIISMPPQEGKSQRTSRRFPLWALTQNPDLRIAIASYEHGVARRWGRAIRDDITQHGDTLGLSVRDDLSAQHEWQLNGHDGGVYAAGIGGALTGRPVDLLIIDDPVKDRAQADSPTYRQNAWDWWTDVGSTRLAPGAPVVVILTRWHHDDLAGRLLNAEDGHRWRVVNIPAEAIDAQDPLDREPGEFMQSARGRTVEQWQRIRTQVGPRTWASLYQGQPSPVSSGIFPGEWPRYTHRPWLEQPDGSRRVLDNFDAVIMSWDLAFKDTDTSDYVVGQVWGRSGHQAWLLDMTRARLDFTGTIAAIEDMRARWPQAHAVFIEDKANGPAVITSLSSRIPGIIPVEPDGGKYARAVAIQPFTAAGNVLLPDPQILPAVTHLTDEAADFPNGQHDDTVDALTQALNQMFLHPILTDTGDVITTEDLFDLHVEDLGGY
ncbi:MAG: phage terminase large subunit [Brachybacterium sp.]|uniref:phage terminase large subunit n=1 Tax=Brachybacterium sp. TaxID=1891286 RepID=UPI002647FFFF|nr:phage terminase large subunit [Brachybacterium sp.]MDN5687119.1 phage terminase large subunit [Brachybacterium sp.]